MVNTLGSLSLYDILTTCIYLFRPIGHFGVGVIEFSHIDSKIRSILLRLEV